MAGTEWNVGLVRKELENSPSGDWDLKQLLSSLSLDGVTESTLLLTDSEDGEGSREGLEAITWLSGIKDTVSCTGEGEDVEQLLAALATKHHYIEYETESDSDSLEVGNVITACLHIPLQSPAAIRAVLEVSHQALSELSLSPGFSGPTSGPMSGPMSPLSPLSELSHRLTRRLASRREMLEMPELVEAETQTSVCSSTLTLPPLATTLPPPLTNLGPLSPGRQCMQCMSPPVPVSPSSIASSDLPNLSPCPIPPNVKQAKQTMAATIGGPSSPSAFDATPESSEESMDSLQDKLFDAEEMERVRRAQATREAKPKAHWIGRAPGKGNHWLGRSMAQREGEGREGNLGRKGEGGPPSPCPQCKEKQRIRHNVRFDLVETEREQERNQKKISLLNLVFDCWLKLRSKYKTKRFC